MLFSFETLSTFYDQLTHINIFKSSEQCVYSRLGNDFINFEAPKMTQVLSEFDNIIIESLHVATRGRKWPAADVNSALFFAVSLLINIATNFKFFLIINFKLDALLLD